MEARTLTQERHHPTSRISRLHQPTTIRPPTQPTPTAPPSTGGYTTPELTRQSIISRTQPAAIVWLVFSALNLLMILLAIFSGLMSIAETGGNEDDTIMLVFCGVLSLFAITGVSGSICMLRMKYHTFCVVASVATMVSSILCCFLPAGAATWAIVALLLPGTRHFFPAGYIHLLSKLRIRENSAKFEVSESNRYDLSPSSFIVISPRPPGSYN